METNSTMKLSNQGLEFLKRREGFDPKCKVGDAWKAHYDPIGKVYDMPYGICFDLDGSRVQKDSVWSNDKVNNVFRVQVEEFEHQINKILDGIWITQSQFDALFSFSWNIGINGFRTSTVVKDLKKGDFYDVARAMLLWTKNKELIPRRQLEVKLWSTGIYE